MISIKGCPTRRAFKLRTCIVAQEAAVVDSAVITRDKIDIAPVEGAAVEPGGVQPVGLSRVICGIRPAVVKIQMGVVAQHATMDGGALFAAADRAEIDVLSVEDCAVKTLGTQPICGARIKGAEGIEGAVRFPFGDQRLHRFSLAGRVVDPGADGQGVAQICQLAMGQCDISLRCTIVTPDQLAHIPPRYP